MLHLYNFVPFGFTQNFMNCSFFPMIWFKFGWICPTGRFVARPHSWPHILILFIHNKSFQIVYPLSVQKVELNELVTIVCYLKTFEKLSLFIYKKYVPLHRYCKFMRFYHSIWSWGIHQTCPVWEIIFHWVNLIDTCSLTRREIFIFCINVQVFLFVCFLFNVHSLFEK